MTHGFSSTDKSKKPMNMFYDFSTGKVYAYNNNDELEEINMGGSGGIRYNSTTGFAEVYDPDNEDWVLFKQLEPIEGALIPTMTSNNAPRGVCSVTSTPHSGQAYMAFDGDPVTSVSGPTSGSAVDCSYVDETAVMIITSIEVAYANSGNVVNVLLRDIYSNNWVEVLNNTSQSAGSHTYQIPDNYKDKSWNGVRVQITGGSITATPAISTIQAYGKKVNV